jgi:hypothetical protein
MNIISGCMSPTIAVIERYLDGPDIVLGRLMSYAQEHRVLLAG